MSSPRVVEALIGLVGVHQAVRRFLNAEPCPASDTDVKATDEVIAGVSVLLPRKRAGGDTRGTLLDRLDGSSDGSPVERAAHHLY